MAILDALLDFVQPVTQLEPVEQQLINDSRQIRDGIAAGTLKLPLDKSSYPAWRGTLHMKNLYQLPNFHNRLNMVKTPLFAGWRPPPAEKSPLPAPKPGLVRGGP